MGTCFQIHPADNVATLLEDAVAQPLSILGPRLTDTIHTRELIRQGHKVALRDILEGDPVIKYGCPIGRATRLILSGECVRLHNCVSNYDKQSSTLDCWTGVRTETAYE